MSEPILELKNISKWYESNAERKILEGLDLKVDSGERFSIVGPSGCGKSTLLNILGTLDSPSGGDVFLNGQSTGGMNEKTLSAIRAQTIGFIFQMHHLLPQCTALENVLVPTLALGKEVNPVEASERGFELLKRVGLGDKCESTPSQLSGGERQRVAVVRALINRPKLLLADEPTGALDEDNAHRLIDLLVELNGAEDLSLIVVTHDMDVANRVGEVRTLKSGKIAPVS